MCNFIELPNGRLIHLEKIYSVGEIQERTSKDNPFVICLSGEHPEMADAVFFNSKDEAETFRTKLMSKITIIKII